MVQTRYITLDDFNNYFVDVDLRESFGNDQSAIAFLYRIEVRLEAYINANFNRNIELEYPNFTDYQKEHYKLALLEQAIYIFKNSDLSVDSGYDPDKGEVMNRERIKGIQIASNCIDQLRLCGIWNRNIRHRGFVWWW